jgi:hypothetical protein
MSKSYVIQWKSKVNGRAGKGTKCFDREGAQRLAGELNREYPDIQHEAVPAGHPVSAHSAGPQANGAGEATRSEAEETAADPDPSFSSR